MSSPNQNSRDMQAWLAQVNAANGSVDEEFGNFGADNDDFGQKNSSNDTISGAAGDGSLD